MRNLMRRARGVVGLGLLWAAGGLAIAFVLELADNITSAVHPLTRLVDMWPQTLAILGFLAGTLFGIVLGIAGMRRRFDELSVPLFTALGALAGLALGLALGAPAGIVGVVTIMSAIGGAGSLALARKAEHRDRLVGGTSARLEGPESSNDPTR